MTKCEDCDQEMIGSESCDRPTITIKGIKYHRNRSNFDVNKRCHDCGIINKQGNYHHLGCDIERCPKCKGQLISCGCWKG